MRVASLLFASFTGLTIIGCNEDPGAGNGLGDHAPAPLASSTSTSTGPAYPTDNHGFAVGQTIDDLGLDGFGAPQVDNSELQKLHFSDFYNPHAGDPSYAPASAAEDDRLYPPGSIYGAGKAKPLALLVALGSVWCGPCNQEAKSIFPSKHAAYRPCGGEIMYVLVEDQPKTLADEGNLRGWTKQYKIDYPAALDGLRQLQPLYADDSFPHAVLIETRTMKIVTYYDALPDSFWTADYEPLLAPGCGK